MSSLPVALVLLLFCAAGAEASDVPDVHFFRDCPPSNCSAGGPKIRYPLRLNTSSPFCGAPGLEVLRCSGDDTVIQLSASETYKVTGIDYTARKITIDTGELLGHCSPRRLPLINVTASGFNHFFCNTFTIVNCSEEVATDVGDGRNRLRGPISCLGGAGHLAYAAPPDLSMDRLPGACEVVATGGVPRPLVPSNDPDRFCNRGSGGDLEFRLWWRTDDGKAFFCSSCEADGGRCGFRRRENDTFCYTFPSRSKPVILITGVTSASVAVITVALFFLYISRKKSEANETRLKVEKFLATYRTTKPTRYSYSDIKKITKRFRYKLGKGGFGSVYRGELPNGIPVAVKLLEKSLGDGDEFINEVATTGRIHHVNVVHLLGFCSEGPRRALVYEFMPNESLEKFIFSKDAKRRQSLSLEKLEEIAIGVARGIEYLHQGCNERILHFDIKPHNILLDPNLNPKISDFGLAMLCSKDQSAVSMTMARGTMGYIAPEVYSRNFGTVSHKSDVYSFGMLLLGMISGRKTVEPSVETNSQVYFPEKIYDRLVQDEEISSEIEMEGSEEIARKLAIVAIWCIQWNPNDRPSMSRVVHMLTGSLANLQIPSTPFVSFSG